MDLSVILRNGEEITVTQFGPQEDGWLIATFRSWDENGECRVWELNGDSLDDFCWDIVEGVE